MKEKMRALRLYAPNEARLEEVPIPRITDDEILIRVLGCGICGSDIKIMHGAKFEWAAPEDKRFIQTPAIPGHEFYGEVVAVGKNRSEYSIGELLIAEQIVPCNECLFCNTGNYWMCKNPEMYGFRNETTGGFAEYMKLHKRSLIHRIPSGFTLKQAVLIEPYACAMHAVERGNIKHNEVVVISGMGAIGLAMIAIARQKQPKTLIALDLRSNRLELSKKFGADYAFNPKEMDVVQKIKGMTDGYGCDLYIEASGSPPSVNQGLESVRSLGKYVQFGNYSDDIMANWSLIGDEKELDIYGSHLGPYCYDAVIAGISNGTIPTEGVVTHVFPLEDWEKAYQAAQFDESAIKVVLVP